MNLFLDGRQISELLPYTILLIKSDILPEKKKLLITKWVFLTLFSSQTFILFIIYEERYGLES